MTQAPRIFVQIPSYRDPDCQWTIKDLFEQASRPERIFVGVFWQFVPELDQDCFVEQTRPEQVRTKSIHARDSLGYSWACAEVEKLWRGEEYTVRLDSHMRFEPGWDEIALETLAACPSPRAVLTTYPMGFTPPRNLQGGGAVTKPVAKDFDDNGILTFNSIINPGGPPPRPMLTAFLAGGFYFGRSEILKEVPWDPYLYFFGTEVSMAVRLWTHGYDLYAPNRSILYHNYERTGRSLHWDDDRKWAAINARSLARVRHLFGTERTNDPETTKDLDRYGFGTARTLQDYEHFTGISFKNRTVPERAKSYHFPYATLEEAQEAARDARIPAPAPAERDSEAGKTPPLPSRWGVRLSTTFEGPGVPPQLGAARGAEAARRALLGKIQTIAIDLMFGADPAALIERLIALGAPPAEARRIIETADNDPLILNGRAMALVLRKRDWLLEAVEKQQRTWPQAATIERRNRLSTDEFLERYYSRCRPVIVTGELFHWNAVHKWTSSYLAATIGGFQTECQIEKGPPGRDLQNGTETRSMPFDSFIRMAAQPEGADRAYMLADDVSKNSAIAGWLQSDLGVLDPFLDRDAPKAGGTIWIGSSGVLTPLHHDLVNCLVAQIAGCNRFKIVAAGEVAKLYNQQHVLSEIQDLDGIEPGRFPALANAKIYDVELQPGEILFMPLAWWYQVTSVGFTASVTYTNFRWPNDSYRSYPLR